jgi:hypothetical protein
MSLTGSAPGVTTGDLLNLQAGIQGFTDTAQAAAEAALIQAGKDTTDAYATRLELANTGQSEVVMATVSLMQNPPGGVPLAGKLVTPTSPTANEFQHLIVSYLPAQQAFAVANKLVVTVYNAEVVALGTGAGGDGTQNNFLKNWGSAALTVSQFETSLSALTNVTVGAIDAQYQFFLKLYGAAPANLPAGYANADAAARATTFGFAVGTDMDNPTLNPALIAEVENAKVLNALTINGDVAGASGYQTFKALALQPIAPPLQGAAGPPTSLVLTVGVDTPTQGFTSGKGATATVAGQTFVATPAGNPPLGVTNTLNAGDDLEATGAAAGNAVLQYSAIASIINPPFATDVIMNGVQTALITNNAGAGITAGFTGNITGLTQVAASGTGGPIALGTPAQGLNTALSQISISGGTAAVPQLFTAWMTAAALGGAKDAATVNALTTDAIVDLNVTGGSTNGYETLTVNSAGTGPNFVALGVGTAKSTATIIETGAQNLTLVGDLAAGSGMNIANLHTYNGKAGTGNQIVRFDGVGNVAATGGSKDDTFVFDNTGNLPGPTFTKDSSVDGGAGMNELEIAATQGALLGAGVGPNITNIQVIEHRAGDGFPGMTGDLTVDMSRAGSATELDLVATYNNAFTVTVTNLTNAQTVLFEGAQGNLILQHAAGGLANVINFTMAADGETPPPPGDLTLNSLTVAPAAGLVALNITSAGNATGDNIIPNVRNVDVSVAITGAHHLTTGNDLGGSYDFLGGIISATTDMGGVQAFIGNSEGAPNQANPPPTQWTQQFFGGPGNDVVNLLNFAGERVDFTTGGNDAVDFTQARFNGGGKLTNAAPFAIADTLYNDVFGFTQANDTILITNSVPFAPGGALFSTNGVVVPIGAAAPIVSTPLLFVTNGVENAAGLADNWIDIITPIGGAGLTVAQGLQTAIGATGAITVNGGHPFLVSYFDLADQQAVFATIQSNAAAPLNVITAADAVNPIFVGVVGIVHMSQADYAALTNNNLHFTAFV